VTNDIEGSSRYSILSDGTLMIDDVRRDDQGTYGCMAYNSAGEAKSGEATLVFNTQETGTLLNYYHRQGVMGKLSYNNVSPVLCNFV